MSGCVLVNISYLACICTTFVNSIDFVTLYNLSKHVSCRQTVYYPLISFGRDFMIA